LSAEDQKVAARRAVLRRLGVYTAVTAPVLLGLLKPEKAIAQTVIGDPIDGVCTTDPSSCF
jgi:hypothetical protein